MESTRKMAFVPVDQQVNMENMEAETTKKKAVITQTQKLWKMIKVILRLANVNGYDEDGRIRAKDGSYIDRSSIVTLLNHTMSVGYPLIGESDFIELLKEAKVSPDMIINENIKSKLLNNYVNSASTIKREPVITTTIERVLEEPKPKAVAFKRKREEIQEPEEEPDELDWEIPRKRFLNSNDDD